MIKENGGPRRAWTFTQADTVLLALWDSDTWTGSAVQWAVASVCGLGSGKPVMMEPVGSIARTAPGARVNQKCPGSMHHMCGLCVRPSARSGRKSSARIPASARAYDWICACSVWSGFERVGRDQIPEVPNKSNPSDPLIERINLTSPNRRRSLTLLSYSDLLSLHQFFFERF